MISNIMHKKERRNYMKALYVVKGIDVERLPKDVVKTRFITLPRWKVAWLMNHRFVFYDQSLDHEDITSFEGMVLGTFLPYSINNYAYTFRICSASTRWHARWTGDS